MTAIAKVPNDVRPVSANQCLIRQLTAGEAVSVGDCVYIKTADGKAYKAAGGAAASALAIGIVVAIGSQGQVTGTGAGDLLSVVLLGPIAGFTVTAGAPAYVSNTAGGLDTAAGTAPCVVGIGLPNNVLYVHPGYPVPEVS